MSDYFFDQAWDHEKRRLDALSALHDPHTFRTLSRLGIAPGARCLEIGAGSGTVAQWMATQVGATGHVVATDIDPRFLAGLSADVEWRRHDVVEDPLEEGSFDLIHARAVLQHIPKREAALAKLVRALRPGGWLCVEDILMPTGAADPELPAFATMLRAMAGGLARSGADPDLGIKLPRMFRAAGLVDVDGNTDVPLVRSATPSVDFYALSIEHAADKLIAAGLIAAADVERTLSAFRTPGTTMLAAVMIATWGRAPASGA